VRGCCTSRDARILSAQIRNRFDAGSLAGLVSNGLATAVKLGPEGLQPFQPRVVESLASQLKPKMDGLRKRGVQYLGLRSCPFGARQKGTTAMSSEISQPRCGDYIVARMPAALRAAVQRASPNRLSEYVRRALVAQLRRDGINLDTDEVLS